MIVCAVKQDTIHPQAATGADLARRLDTTQDLVTDPPCPVVVVPRGDDARACAASAR